MSRKNKFFIFFLIILILLVLEWLIINPLIRKICDTGEYVQWSCEKTEILTYYPTHLVKKIICRLRGSQYVYFKSFFVPGGYECTPEPVPIMIQD